MSRSTVALPSASLPAPTHGVTRWFERVSSAIASLMIRGIAAGYAAKMKGIERTPEPGPVLVQVTFRYLQTPDAFHASMERVAPFLSHVQGLRWKVWSVVDSEQTGNGTYLFESRADADLYLHEILPQGPVGDPSLVSDVQIRVFDVLNRPSTITRMPHA